MPPVPQPPYNHSDIEFFARSQLSPHQIPKDYLEELDRHFIFFPYDHLFRLSPFAGSGYGMIECLEPGCDGSDIILKPSETEADGGLGSGIGGLAAFQDHIMHSEHHERCREIRRQKQPDCETNTTTDQMSSVSNTASQLVGSSSTSSKRPSPALLDQNFRDSKKRRTDPEIISVSLPKAPVPSNDMRSKSTVPDPSKIYIDLDSELRTDDLVLLHERQGSLNRTLDTDSNSNILQTTQSTSALDTGPQPSWPNAPHSFSDPALNLANPALLRMPSSGVSGPQFRAPAGPHARDQMPIHQNRHLAVLPPSFPATHLPSAPASFLRPHQFDHQFRNPSHPEAPILIDGHGPRPLAPYSSRPQYSVNMSNGGIDPRPPLPAGFRWTDSPILIDDQSPASMASYSSRPQYSVNTSNGGIVPRPPLPAGLRWKDSPILIDDQSPASMASYSSRPQYSVNTSDGGIVPRPPLPAGLRYKDPSITHVQFSAINSSLGSNEFARPGGPALGHISPERQLFYKLAVDNAVFEHNTTLEEARKVLDIDDSNGALMDGLAMPLMPHQLIGVSWMLKQEKGRHRGGILGDEMGMGKTMQMIATMVKNRSTDPKVKSTLILAPLGLLTQWREEIEEKTTRDFKILLYHGSHYKPTSKREITKYDVVVTTLSTLSREWFDANGASKKRKQDFISDDEDAPVKGKMGPLLKIKWYRVVIDEAQNIRNQQSVCSRAVCSLQTTYRWSLTGTPIFNGLWDIFPLLRFLGIRPYNDKLEFRNHIAQYEKNRPDLAGDRAQAVLLTCMLRRQKTTELDGQPLVNLPPKTIENQMLEMSPKERDIYDSVEKRIQAKFNKFLKKGTVSKNYAHVFVLLLRLRQACGHPSLVTEEGEATHDEDTSEPDEVAQHDADSELERATSRMGQEWVDMVKKNFQAEAAELVAAERRDPTSAAAPECPICNDPLDDTARITKCNHVFCEGCIDNLIESVDPGQMPDERIPDPNTVTKPCPDCRKPFSRLDTFLKKAFFCPDEDGDDEEDDEMPNTSCLVGKRRRTGVINNSDDEDSSDGGFVPSTKMIWLLEELNRVKKENPDDKTIVISQWTSMLDLVATYLSRHGYEYVRYQGNMSTVNRNEAVRTFRRDPDVPIMLMSLKCGGVGLNLTRGNRVISLDLAWSPATEAQAFDRVHRLGQAKAVFVKRIMINRTVEQRISDLQRVKQEITDHALGEGSGKKLQRMTVAQLANLFNLDTAGRRCES